MSQKVLIVDDDEKLRSLVIEYLEGYGYETIALPDGLRATETIKTESPDIVILDVMMPKKDGLEILKDIRRDYDLPVIMLTAKGEDADRIVGLELGADDYLPKPFNPRELLARIKAVTRRLRVQVEESRPQDFPGKEDIQRQLKAIFCADVKGYSRLMADDEMSTIDILKKYKDLIEAHVHRHLGRVVDSPGDNILAEFNSVIKAVQCAIEVQKDLEDKNEPLPEERRMDFRIGINLGDVVMERGRIYGDGVNIAARIEGLAEGGGICISGSVFDQVEDRFSMRCEYLGEKSVKNIKKPIRVYKITLG